MKKKNPLIHVKGDPYLHAANLEKLGVDTYNQEVLERWFEVFTYREGISENG